MEVPLLVAVSAQNAILEESKHAMLFWPTTTALVYGIPHPGAQAQGLGQVDMTLPADRPVRCAILCIRGCGDLFLGAEPTYKTQTLGFAFGCQLGRCFPLLGCGYVGRLQQ